MDVIVIGGGLSGLAAAWLIEREAERRSVIARVKVLEARGRTGGKIATRHDEGFVVEEAANGWLASTSHTEDLCAALGIAGDIERASHASRRRFIVRGGRLRELSPHPFKLISEGVVSVGGALRLAREPFIARGLLEDESVADFARRRLGAQALERFIDPMVSGVFAGDPEALSLPSAYPRLAALEREHGSLARGLVRVMREGAEGRALLSLRGGVGRLVEALRQGLGTPPTLGSAVISVGRFGAHYVVRRADGTRFVAPHVVVATPSHVSAALLEGLDGELARDLIGVPYAPIAVVALGFAASALPEGFPGFGFLAPEREGRPILGTLWESNVFAGRAPVGTMLTRTMIGGARHPERARWPASDLVRIATAELRELTGVREAPVFHAVKQHERGIPQYVVGHGARLSRIDARLAALPGLWLTGNAYRGVSVNDCVVEAGRLATRLFDGAKATA